MVALGPLHTERSRGTKEQEAQSLLLADLLHAAFNSQVSNSNGKVKLAHDSDLLSAIRQVVQEGHITVHLT